MKKIFLIINALLLIFLSYQVYANQKILKVAVSEGAPFSSLLNQVPSGIAVELWETIAQKNHWQYQFIPVGENVDKAIKNLEKNQYDILVGPISTTTEREKHIDFSRPYYISDTGIIKNTEKNSSWLVLIHLFEAFFVQTSIIFFILCLLFAHVYWFFEHDQNQAIPNHYFSGISYTLWHVFYHLFKGGPLHVPKTIIAKGVVIIWMITALFFFISLTATLTSSLTVSLSEGTDFKSIDDLHSKKLAVISGTTGLKQAHRVHAKTIIVPNLQKGLDLLEKDRVFGVIEDRVIAKHFLQDHVRDKEKVSLSKLNLGYNELTFAFPPNSKLREKFDRALIALQDNGAAKKICKQFVGDLDIYCDF